jgi:hypothetical protein
MTNSEKAQQLHAELVQALEQLKSSEDWQRALDVAARFHRYSTGRSAIFQRFESLPSRRWTQRSVQ